MRPLASRKSEAASGACCNEEYPEFYFASSRMCLLSLRANPHEVKSSHDGSHASVIRILRFLRRPSGMQ